MAHTIKPDMQELWESSQLNGASAAWLESLYEAYLTDPETVEPEWRGFFDSLPKVKSGNGGIDGGREVPHNEIRDFFRAIAKDYHPVPTATPSHDIELERKQVHVLQLINAYRFRGHQHANTNPLINSHHQIEVPELDLAYHQLGEADFDTVFETGSLAGPETLTLGEIYQKVRNTYCGSTGAEYMHIMETAEKRWLQQRLELTRGKIKLTFDEKINILQQLSNAEGLEKYLHTKYVGQKRFSLEGGESLIPLLDELVMHGGALGVKEVVIGMAHRGRLNVLVNILGKTPAELFAEFEGTKDVQELTGDVKYHLGFSSDMQSRGGPVHLALAFNPSHLEIVGPVVLGSVRARQWRRGDAEGVEVIPVQIHGDAAFSGQGVVMESLQMSQSRGFSTKGTIHIIVNNQIGFTTSYQKDARSTHYCTDVAKMVDAPIFHVNGDDPEAVIMVTRLAMDYRMAFKKDVVIDLVCYRRHGHNEADEPKATQPMMYKKIASMPTTRAIYANRLVNEGVLSNGQADEVVANVRKALESGHCVLPHKLPSGSKGAVIPINWKQYTRASLLDDIETGVPIETIRELAAGIEQLPEGFVLQGRVQKIMDDRHRMTAGALPLDWGYAETMAYASLLNDGYAVRLSGQDSGRGTFFHRHAVLHNQKDGTAFVPLRSLGKGSRNFLVIDSLLSEMAVLGFEYGFSTADPEVLPIWEAQFGDFANGAQVVIDQFISSGEHKWGKLTGLVMLLPHGFEGQGAEHSSGRIERYLQLCSSHNIQVCVPSTPAQMFHLLRRQTLRDCRKPMVVITPKSLLRHKECTSSLDDLTTGYYQRVLPEVDAIDPAKVKYVLLCSGKIYYELLNERRAKKRNDIAIIRTEQLYPFPGPELNVALEPYRQATELIWVQEEPKNQGAWDFVKPRIPAMLDKEWNLSYVGRVSSSAPAVGSAKLHGIQQRDLVDRAINFNRDKNRS
ncbi:MAG: 2-oxoglutarate dehydrogenase E1 component [Thiotrichales bacterium]|nr:MAG: 2-oxoglutarate dehydrogenase E1 component [Thiotrichales bacterium]